MKALATSWKREPFGEGVPLPYTAAFGSADLARIRDGVVPQSMDDKWFIYEQDGHVYFHRGWTGQAVFRVGFDERGRVREALISKDLVAGRTLNAAYEARVLDYVIRFVLLGQEDQSFPMPPELLPE